MYTGIIEAQAEGDGELQNRWVKESEKMVDEALFSRIDGL